MTTPTNVNQFFEELEAGIVHERLGVLLTSLAAAAMRSRTASTLTLKMSIKPVESSQTQVEVKHDITSKMTKITGRGTVQETDTGTTILYSNEDSTVSLYPTNQMDAFALLPGEAGR